jgi:hypothetical protein
VQIVPSAFAARARRAAGTGGRLLRFDTFFNLGEAVPAPRAVKGDPAICRRTGSRSVTRTKASTLADQRLSWHNY